MFRAVQSHSRLAFTVVLALGLLIRIYFSVSAGFDWDSSIFLYQAVEIQNGARLFGQVLTTTPLYVDLLRVMAALFGNSLWADRYLSFVSSALTLVLVYLVTKELFDQRVALMSMSIYALVPTIAFFSVTETYRSVILPFALGAFYLVLIGHKRNSSILCLISGVVLGASLWLYFGSIFYLPILMYVLFSQRVQFQRHWQMLMVFVTGYLLGLASFGLLILLQSNWQLLADVWFSQLILGFGGGAGGASRLNPVFFNNYLLYMMRFLYIQARNYSPLFMLIFVYILSLSAFLIRGRTFVKKASAGAVMIIISIVFVYWDLMGMYVGPKDSYGAFTVAPVFGKTLQVLLFGSSLAVPNISRIVFPSMSVSRWRHSIVLVWLGLATAYLLSFNLPHTFYFFWVYTPPLAVTGGYVVQAVLISKKGGLLVRVFFAMVLLSAIVGGVMVSSSTIPEETLSPVSASAVGSYIVQHTNRSSYIFTAEPVYAVYAHRLNVGLDNYYYYFSRISAVNYSALITNIYNLMSSGQIEYIVLDPHGATAAVLSQYPALDNLFHLRYHLEANIQGVELWRFYYPQPPQLNSGLVGYWKFDDGSGTTARDSSGNNNNGTLVNNPQWVQGKFGYALEFNAANSQYVSLNSLNRFPSAPNPVSVSLWVYLNNLTGTQVLFSYGKGTQATGNDFFIAIEPNGALALGTYGNDFVSNFVLNTRQWYNIVGIYNGGSSATVCLNGVCQSGTLSLSLTPNFTPIKGAIGALLSPSPSYFVNGIIDDVRVYNRALSVGEAFILYAQSGA